MLLAEPRTVSFCCTLCKNLETELLNTDEPSQPRRYADASSKQRLAYFKPNIRSLKSQTDPDRQLFHGRPALRGTNFPASASGPALKANAGSW